MNPLRHRLCCLGDARTGHDEGVADEASGDVQEGVGKLKDKVKQRVDQKADKAMDDALNQVECIATDTKCIEQAKQEIEVRQVFRVRLDNPKDCSTPRAVVASKCRTE